MEKTKSQGTVYPIVILMLSTVTLDSISGFVRGSGTAAPISAVLTILIALFCAFVVNTAFGGRSFFDVICTVFGKKAGFLVMLGFFVLTVFNASVRMEMFTRAICGYILKQTPKVIVMTVLSLCAFFVSFFGTKAISRYAYTFFLIFVVFALIIIFSSSAKVNFDNLFPLLGKGNFKNVFSMMYIFSDFIYLYVLSDKSRKSATKSIAAGAAVTLVLTAFYVLCVPYPVSEGYNYPLYTLASLSNSSVIFQRLDGLVYVIWMFAGFISVGTLVLTASRLFSDTFGIKDRKATSACLALLVFLSAMTGLSSGGTVCSIMSWTSFVVLPLVAVIYRIVRKRKNA